MISLERLKWHLNSYDPYCLTGFNVYAPDDEYDTEAEEIYSILSGMDDPTREDAERVIREVFYRNFGGKEPYTDISYLARTVITDDVYICPVCKKYYFFMPAIHNICKVCGWEDDLVQYSEHYYTGGANPLNVRIAQMEYHLLNEDKTADECRKLIKEYNDDSRQIYIDAGNDWDYVREKKDELNQRYARSLAKLYVDKSAVCRDEAAAEDMIRSFVNNIYREDREDEL